MSILVKNCLRFAFSVSAQKLYQSVNNCLIQPGHVNVICQINGMQNAELIATAVIDFIIAASHVNRRAKDEINMTEL